MTIVLALESRIDHTDLPEEFPDAPPNRPNESSNLRPKRIPISDCQ